MLKTGTFLNELYKSILPLAENRKVTDLRIGLGYTGIRLENNATGIAAILFDVLPHGCTVMPTAGSFAGLACANALIKTPSDFGDNQEATTYLNLKPGEKVAMVGLFAPLVDKIRATGAILTVIEKNPQRLELLSPEAKQQALQDCNVAIITATTLLNNTFEETVSYLGKPRSVALPSAI